MISSDRSYKHRSETAAELISQNDGPKRTESDTPRSRTGVLEPSQMPLYPTYFDIGLRLLLTFVACGLIGLDREMRGHPAGLRTTMLVGLAASVAMIQTNILLPMDGKTPSSFAVMDLMRLPLGILTGVGFIGGGAILRYGASVKGVTTAATLWVVTVIGLCMGGGQLILGCAATALVIATLWLLKAVDLRLSRVHRARVTVETVPGGTMAGDVPPVLDQYDHRFIQHRELKSGAQLLTFEVRWSGRSRTAPPQALVEGLMQSHRLKSFELIQGDH